MKFRIGQYLDFSQKFQALRPAGLYRDYQVLYLAAVIDIAVAPGIFLDRTEFLRQPV